MHGYRDMDVTNLDQNPLILSEGSHLGMSLGNIYVNNLSVVCYIFMKIGTWHNFEVRNPKVTQVEKPMPDKVAKALKLNPDQLATLDYVPEFSTDIQKKSK